MDKMLYPFITQHLAPYFGAAVIQIEHRFYGPYQPIMGRDVSNIANKTMMDYIKVNNEKN